MIRFLMSAWDRLSLYLPVGLMGLLALGTYWLVQNTPSARPPPVQGPVRHEADYFMKNFSVKTFFANGKLKSEVFGSAARHYPDTDTLEIEQVRTRSMDALGRLTTARAERALTNGDASEVQLYGQARIVREALSGQAGAAGQRFEFRGEFLHAFMNTERVMSDQPVEMRRGLDVFSADAMEFDNLRQTMTMQGRVRGTLVPAPPN